MKWQAINYIVIMYYSEATVPGEERMSVFERDVVCRCPSGLASTFICQCSYVFAWVPVQHVGRVGM